ncbi:MAG: cupin-like domain-containing protein [Polyangiaceae bacterium]|nr:cupin-like domain-containing protein [Polyangiaceae bacterium]
MHQVHLIERREQLDYQEFVNNYLLPQRPVLIANATALWGASKWTPEWFIQHFPHKEVQAEGQTFELGTLLSRMLAEEPTPYLKQLDIPKHFPELLPFLTPDLAYSLPNRTGSRFFPKYWFGPGSGTLQLFIGGQGASQGIVHADMPPLHSYSALLAGQKEWWVWAPSEGRYLYTREDYPHESSIKNVFEPDLARYPELASASVTRVVQQPGDLLFLPMGWWHTARTVSASPTITVAWDVLCQKNWQSFVDHIYVSERADHPVRARLLRTYLQALGPVLNVFEARAGVGATT